MCCQTKRGKMVTAPVEEQEAGKDITIETHVKGQKRYASNCKKKRAG